MSLAATVISRIVVNNPDFDKNEHRLSEYGALNFFYEASRTAPLLSQEMRAKAIRSVGQVIDIPVLKFDGTIAVSNSRSCSVADAENESAMVNVTFTTYFVGFTMVPAQYTNNAIDYDRDFEAKLKKCARVLGAALDSAAITALETNKTKVIADPLLYTDTSGVLTAPWEARESFLGDIDPIMGGNDFVGSLHFIGNVGVKSLLADLQKHMTYNEYDNSMEWEGKKFHFTNRLSNGDGKYATFYAVEEGNVDMLFRYDRETAIAAESGVAVEANGHSWEVIRMPYLGIPVGLHSYTSVGDMSAIAGDATADLTCARKEFYGFSVDVAFVVAYNSALSTKANPIIKGDVTTGTSYARPVQVVGVVSTKEVEE